MNQFYYNGNNGRGPAPAEKGAGKVLTRKNIITWVSMLLLYLSFCFYALNETRWVFGRIPLYYSALFEGGAAGQEMAGGIWIYFVYGLIEMLIFEALSRLYFMLSRRSFPIADRTGLLFYLRFFFLGRNIILGLMQLILFAAPVSYVYISTVLPNLVTVPVLAGFFFFVRGKCFPKEASDRALKVIALPYLGIIFIYAIFSVVGGVL